MRLMMIRKPEAAFATARTCLPGAGRLQPGPAVGLDHLPVAVGSSRIATGAGRPPRPASIVSIYEVSKSVNQSADPPPPVTLPTG